VIVLGMDTSTTATAVALALADGSVREVRDDPPAGAHPGHATRLLQAAGSLISGAGIGWGDIGRIGVGAGPGTFTGLRIGVATARGLAQSLGAQLIAVPSTAALALPALQAAAGAPVLACIDARRGEIFAAAYGPGVSELSHPCALAPELVLGSLEGDGLDAGGRAGMLAVGDGALRYRQQLQESGIEVAPEDSPLHLLLAESICRLAASAEPSRDYQLVLPDYRRRPDAELALGGVA
jgi:tRNA threonylcarbamoyladenosine biosynthesis protein TsaB